jgi:5-enolpyruvylshikimate-3-phosphate synthase
MACAILGLYSKGETVIEDTGCIATSYPTFQEDLQKVATFQETGLASLLSTRDR